MRAACTCKQTSSYARRRATADARTRAHPRTSIRPDETGHAHMRPHGRWSRNVARAQTDHVSASCASAGVFSPASSQRASVSCAAPMPPSAAAFIIANLPSGATAGGIAGGVGPTVLTRSRCDSLRQRWQRCVRAWASDWILYTATALYIYSYSPLYIQLQPSIYTATALYIYSHSPLYIQL